MKYLIVIYFNGSAMKLVIFQKEGYVVHIYALSYIGPKKEKYYEHSSRGKKHGSDIVSVPKDRKCQKIIFFPFKFNGNTFINFFHVSLAISC